MKLVETLVLDRSSPAAGTFGHQRLEKHEEEEGEFPRAYIAVLDVQILVGIEAEVYVRPELAVIASSPLNTIKPVNV